MKETLLFGWIAAFLAVSIYGVKVFNNTLRQHYYDEAQAAQMACFHKIDELEILRGAPYAGGGLSGCGNIGTSSDYYGK